MSQYDFESNYDGDWDDGGEIAWNEADWQRYLRDSDKEISRFIAVYNSVREKTDRLDEAAHLMGWDNDDWSVIEDELGFAEESALNDQEEDEACTDSDPYTIHKHPVYISTTALYVYLRASWEHLMRNNRVQPQANLVWSYCASLADGERHSLLGAQSLDLGDYQLAVCHFKKSHSALNESLRLNRLFEHHNTKIRSDYLEETSLRMHDIREVWLRVMQDCRR
jgi:hypothetical protein